MMGDTDLKEIDVGMCCSKETVRKIELAREGMLNDLDVATRDDWSADGLWEAAGKESNSG